MARPITLHTGEWADRRFEERRAPRFDAAFSSRGIVILKRRTEGPRAD